jgi:peptidyl-tRNA hydrolase
MQEELIQYYIVNEDLVDKENNPVKMSAGKLAAQVAHVATKLAVDGTREYAKSIDSEIGRAFIRWYSSNLHKKIILQAHQKVIDKIIYDSNLYGRVKFTKDFGLTEIKPNQTTVVGLMPIYKSDLPKYIQRLQLYRG